MLPRMLMFVAFSVSNLYACHVFVDHVFNRSDDAEPTQTEN